MGRQLTLKNNQFAPSGVITLTRPIEKNKKKYVKVWAPFWDIIVKDESITNDKELDKKENWIWHCLWNDKVLYFVDGAKVRDYHVSETPPFNDSEVWIPEEIRKYLKRKETKNDKRERRGD